MTLALHQARGATRWELDEITAAATRGDETRWGVQDYAIAAAWLLVLDDGRPRHVYAPLEHPELPHQFACLANAPDAAILPFAQTYGRLGRLELIMRAVQDARLRPVIDATIARTPDNPRVDHEPLAWIRAHAATVGACLEAGAALASGRAAACRRVLDRFPDPWGRLHETSSAPLVAHARGATTPPGGPDGPPRLTLAHLVADVLTINLRPYRVQVRSHDAAPRLFLGAPTLITAIYFLTASALGRRGAVARCEQCGRAFVQTDARQRFCPPRAGQDRSSCGTLARVHRKRRRDASRRRRRPAIGRR